MFELEQRLMAVEHELKQVKQAQLQQANQVRNTPASGNAEGRFRQEQGTTMQGPLQHQAPQQGMPMQSPQQHAQPPQQGMPLQSPQQHAQPPQQGIPMQRPQQHAQPPQQGIPMQRPQQPNQQLGQQDSGPAQQVQHQPPYNYVRPPYNPTTKKQSSSMESVLVKVVLPIVFIVVLLIGILMLFIAGVAYGLISEPIRCLLGVVLAAGMYVIGMLQHSYKRPIWGKALLGGAHGIFIITVSVAHLSYELIGVAVASLLYLLSFGLIVLSALRWRSQLLVTIAIISGYLCMFLIDITSVQALLFIIIQLIFSVSMLLLSMKLRYRYAYGFAYMLLHLSLLITYGVHEHINPIYLLTALILQHLVVFIQFVIQKRLHVEHTIAQFFGAIILISWTSHLYNNTIGTSWRYAAVTLLLAIVYACALLYFERKSDQEPPEEETSVESIDSSNSTGPGASATSPTENNWLQSLRLRTEFSALITAFSLLFFFIEILGASFSGLVFMLIGVSLLLFGMRDEHKIMSWFGVGIAAIGMIAIVFDWPTKLLSYEVLSWIVMLGSILLVYRECKEAFAEHEVRYTLLPTILWTEAALFFIFVTTIGGLIGESISVDAESYMVSLSWLLYAISAIILGSIRKLKKARLTGIILLLVIVVKLIFIDMTFLNIITRSVMFTVLGVIGIIVSFILYNRTDDKQD